MSIIKSLFRKKDSIVCPGCGMAMKPSDMFCTGCGHARPAAPAALVCPACGERVEEGDRFCMNCGAALTQAEAAEAVVPEEPAVSEPEEYIEHVAAEPVVTEWARPAEETVEITEEAPAEPDTYTLKFTDGSGREEELHNGDLIGRQAGCALVLDEPGISRSHCRIVRMDGKWQMEILGMNGIYICGKHYPDGYATLANGDIIEFPGVNGNIAVQYNG